MRYGSSAHGWPPVASADSMKKASNSAEMRANYDFSAMKGGVRGKYVERLGRDRNIILLEPDIALAFPTEAAVNEALRGVLNTARAVRSTGGLSDRTLEPGRRRRPAKQPAKPTNRSVRG